MKYIVKKNQFIFFSLFFANLLFALFTYLLLPDKFFYDSTVICDDPFNEIGFFGSYPFAILFYKATFLKFLPYPIIAVIQYSILIYLLFRLGVPRDFNIANSKNILTYLGFFLLALYVSMPSKEFITFLIVMAIPFLYLKTNYSDKKKIILSLIVFLASSFFRAYNVLIPIFAVAMYLFSFIKIQKKALKIIGVGVLLSIIVSLSSAVITKKYITQSTREQLNEFRKEQNDKDTNSKFVSPIPANTWYGETVSIVNGFFEVNIPILAGIKQIYKPQVVAFVIWQLAVLYILLIKLSNCLKNKKESILQLFAILFLLSYFIVQGLFEPDLGSAIRHKIGFFPLIYFIFYYEDFKLKI